jgi:hypothetical protein
MEKRLGPAAVTGFFLAAHHAGPAATGTQELPFLMGRMGHLPHLDLASLTKHTTSNYAVPHLIRSHILS